MARGWEADWSVVHDRAVHEVKCFVASIGYHVARAEGR